MKVQLGELLKKQGYINDKHINIALSIKKIYPSKLFGEILKDLYFVSSAEIAKALAAQSNTEYINLNEVVPSENALKLVPKELSFQFKILPINVESNVLHIATPDPYNVVAFDIIKRRSNLNLKIYVAEEEQILKLIHIHYFLLENPVEKQIEALLNRLRTESIGNVLPELVNFILNEAIIDRASDIHISPQYISTDVFFRIDGVLKYFLSLPKELHPAIVSRIKVMSSLDIAEQRLPQDGSFTHKFMEDLYDMRVSTVPSAFGENVVIRILTKSLSMFSLESLGLRDFQYRILNKNINKSQGIILFTGPTGSGKTTSLYSVLRKINVLERNVITVEDPVEYKFPFIKQTQVNEKIGYTFKAAIKSFLRQDPDVMLIGEIRDSETAEMAIRSSITGHLVLSTLHTNDAISTIPRLLDLNVAPFLLSTSLNLIVSQRLVRKVCPFCREKVEIPSRRLLDIGFSLETLKKWIKTNTINVYYGRGCKNCGGTGFLGRKVVAEMLEIDKDISNMIAENVSPIKILEKAKDNGMITMEEVGLMDVLDNLTTPEEVIRVIG